MIDRDQMMLDRIARLESQALDGIAPHVAEGSRLLETQRRIDQALGWLTAARRGCDPADAVGLAQAHTHLCRARDRVKQALT